MELTYEQRREAKKLFDKLTPYVFGTRGDPVKLDDAKYELGYYLLTEVAGVVLPDVYDVFFTYNYNEQDTLFIFVSYKSEDTTWLREDIEFII